MYTSECSAINLSVQSVFVLLQLCQCWLCFPKIPPSHTATFGRSAAFIKSDLELFSNARKSLFRSGCWIGSAQQFWAVCIWKWEHKGQHSSARSLLCWFVPQLFQQHSSLYSYSLHLCVLLLSISIGDTKKSIALGSRGGCVYESSCTAWGLLLSHRWMEVPVVWLNLLLLVAVTKQVVVKAEPTRGFIAQMPP